MLRECSTDAKTNEFYCAYGVCPNIFHFYYMVDISYRQFSELKETIIINKENGFEKQVQKDTNMIKTIAKNKLLPELKELKKILNDKGYSYVIEKYPNLEDIIKNYNSIMGEISEWIN